MVVIPPKTHKNFYAYKTAASLKNPRNFKVANRLVGLLLLISGAVLLALALVTRSFLVTAIIAAVAYIVIYTLVEIRLKTCKRLFAFTGFYLV